jgi:predicted metalloprotease with PDZ domain
MAKYCTAILFALVFAIAGVHAQTTLPSSLVVYTLAPDFTQGSLTGLLVTIHFRGEHSGRTVLLLPDRWAGEKELWRNLKDVTVEGATSVAEDGGARRIILADPDAKLTVHYRVVSAIDHEPTFDDGQPFKPWIRPTWFYAFGEGVFAVPEGRVDSPAQFDWKDTHSTFHFASDLEHLAGEARVATRPGVVGDVQESILLGGDDVQLISHHEDGGDLHIALRGATSFSADQFDTLVTKIIHDERDFWGDKGQPFLVTLVATKSPQQVVSLGGSGRTDAFTLSIADSTKIEPIRALLSHEYFHTWNPRQLGSMPNGPEEFLGSWFSEGFTDFYTRNLLLRYGLFSQQDFADSWNKELSSYANSSVRDASNQVVKEEFWKNYEVQKLPYHRGAMLAAIWNQRLSHSSAGKLNLDSILRRQHQEAKALPRKPEGGAPALFVKVAASLGLDVTNDLKRFIDDGSPILLPADVFGPCFEVTSETKPRFDYGFDVEATGKAGNVITGLRKDSPAYMAGMRDGMRLTGREAGVPGDSSQEYALKVEDGGVPRVIRFLPKGKDDITLQRVVVRKPAVGQSCTAG